MAAVGDELSPEWVMPAKTAKATKVAIIAVHGSSVLDSMSGNQGIGGEIPARASRLEQREEDTHRLAGGREQADMRLGEPGLYNAPHFGGCHRPVTDRGVCEEPRKSQHDHPRNPNRFVARERRLPPMPGRRVPRSDGIVGKHENVCVDNDHEASRSDSTSSWS